MRCLCGNFVCWTEVLLSLYFLLNGTWTRGGCVGRFPLGRVVCRVTRLGPLRFLGTESPGGQGG